MLQTFIFYNLARRHRLNANCMRNQLSKSCCAPLEQQSLLLDGIFSSPIKIDIIK